MKASAIAQTRDQRVTERKALESEQRLRELSAHAESVREEERRQLALKLHDELGQLFTTIRLELAGAISEFRKISTSAKIDIVDRLQCAAGLTDIGIASLRQLTSELRPPILDHLGLVPAIRWESSLFSQRTNIRCYVRATPASMKVDEAVATALYRIFLEAMANVARHAKAGAVRVSLTQHDGLTVMDIRDNGRGITAQQVDNPHTMGLIGMRERALSVGGHVRITGARGRGTRVVVTVRSRDRGSRRA